MLYHIVTKSLYALLVGFIIFQIEIGPVFTLDPVALTEQSHEILNNWEGNSRMLARAEFRLKLAMFLQPDYADAYSGYARATYYSAYFGGKHYHPEGLIEAHEFVDKALELDSLSVHAHVNKGWIYVYQEDTLGAKGMLQRVMKLNPDHPRVLLLHTEIMYNDKKFDEARDLARRVLGVTQQHGDSTRAYGKLADIAASTRRWEDGELVYQDLLRLQPNSAWTHINYCIFLIGKQDYDRAIEIGEKAVDLGSMGNAYWALALAYYEKGRQLYWEDEQWVKSADYFEMSIENDDTNPDAYYGLGVGLRARARYYRDIDIMHQSEAAFEEALRLKPDHELALKELQRHRAHMSQYE